jgi:hypothetical protein
MYPMHRVITVLVTFTAAVLLCASMSAVQAAEYCCTCKGQTAGKTIDAGSRAQAIGQCSLECSGFTNVASGKCAAPPPAPVAAPTAAPAPSAASSNVVLAYKSEDCSGDSLRVTGSTARLDPGLRSFQVDSGNPANAWEKPDYAGLHTEFVGPSMCVSPGFEIRSIKLM